MGKLIFLVLFAVALAVFASQNTALVQLQFLAWKSQQISLALIIIVSVAAGAALAVAVSIPMHHRRRKELALKKREVEELRERIH